MPSNYIIKRAEISSWIIYNKNIYKKFILLLELRNEKRDEEILSQIAKELFIEIHKENSFLMKIGEIEKYFHYTLKGLNNNFNF